MKPNLFNYATSELSNDAMICWMLEWGNYRNSSLYGLSKELISKFTEIELNYLDINKVEIQRQYKNIDLKVEVNNEYIIIIEDKIDTTDHSDQLARYRNIIKEENNGKYDESKMFFIYLTIGDESSYKRINDTGYSVIKRVDILEVLEAYKSENNDILRDYYEHLSKIDSEVNSYKVLNHLEKWGWRAWQGFFMKLQEEMNDIEVGWSYVNNPSGGFQAFWWHFHQKHFNESISYTIYLQIENNRIAFKVAVEDKRYQSIIRDYVWEKFEKISREANIEEYKTKKTIFRKGTWMTIAEINNLQTKDDIKAAMRVAEKLIDQLNKVL